MSQLALLGGTPAFNGVLRRYNSIGAEEIDAVNRVMRSGCLSGYVGAWVPEFYGGPVVRQLEQDWARRFGVRHAVSMNSATSGLMAAMGAIGLEPGDEVIVPPLTMSATAMAPLVYGGIPVFADLDVDDFCLDPALVEQSITPRTRAIMVVNLFGQPAKLQQLRVLADQRGIWLIEDNAQSPLATEGGTLAGTIGHIGIFSLNFHKHVHAGEGGVCVTNDDELALRLQLIRNHGENSVEPSGAKELAGLVGFNYRMTELHAAVGVEQLKKMAFHVQQRETAALRLLDQVSGLTALRPPKPRANTRHVYYMWQFRYDIDAMDGIPRDVFVKAANAEGFPCWGGFVAPLYLLPVFRERRAFGRSGWPFSLSDRRYARGLCPRSECLSEQEMIGFDSCGWHLTEPEVDGLAAALTKVYENRDQLRGVTA